MSTASSHAGTTVLVTGARGFVGGWLVRRLLADGARVIAARPPADNREALAQEPGERSCDVVELDVLDLSSVMRALEEHEVELVFHLAARGVPDRVVRSPLAAFETNVRGTYHLLEACRMTRPNGSQPRIVVASSSHVYGRAPGASCSEESPLHPRALYDVSKACSDLLARSYAATYELPVAVTRMANIYGGGDRNWSRVVPGTARALVRGDVPVIRSDGAAERNWLYVEDAVDAYLAVAGSLETPAHWGRAWNVGMERAVSVLDLVRMLIAASGRRVEPELLGDSGQTQPSGRQLLDSGAIRRELGWRSRWTLEQGLAETLAWYRRHEAESRSDAVGV